MNISLVARVGRSIGLGHWGRSLNLARELTQRGHRVALQAVPVELADGPMPSTPFVRDFLQTDVQVVDDPIAPFSLLEEARLRVGIDFFQDPQDQFHIGINAIDRTPPEIVARSSMLRLVGMEYLLVDAEAATLVPVNSHEKKLLIVMGGKDVRRYTLPLLSMLQHQGLLERFHAVRAVAAIDHPHREELVSLASRLKNLEILDLQPSILPQLQWASLVVCNGGMVAMLTILQQRDAVFFPQAKQEEELLTQLAVNPHQMVSLNRALDESSVREAFQAALQSPKPAQTPIDIRGCERVSLFIEKCYAQRGET